jgi:hypothetical protein
VDPLHPSRQENETLPDRRLAIQSKTKAAVEAYYSEFLGLQKDRIVKQMLSNRLERVLFPKFQSSLWSFFDANKIAK